MATLELHCRRCDHTWFSNQREPCPRCGNDEIRVYHDEEVNYSHEPDHEEDTDHDD